MAKLKANLKELDERRSHVNQLNDQIGTINARLVEMGQNVSKNLPKFFFI
jgi:hypothetical protein